MLQQKIQEVKQEMKGALRALCVCDSNCVAVSRHLLKGLVSCCV